jgi:hypothetical protein
MPQFLEQELMRGAAKHGLAGKDRDRYVFGAMNKKGYMRGNRETPKGKALERKHLADYKKP